MALNLSDMVGGTARISMATSPEKGAPWVTLESSFLLSVPDGETREAVRKQGWEEVQKDISEQLAETVSSLRAQQ